MLETIHTPADVRALTLEQTQALAAEIRNALVSSVARTGGHLASNLGAVELTLALHRVLDTPRDRILFDVGHQSYTHKLISGRQSLLSSLRLEGGVSGFPKRGESEYDVFETGHASTAISAAVGLARARDLRGEDYAIAALVGDGALTGGMCYEALNDAGSRPTQMILLLNDNGMSIASNVGALSHHLTMLRGSPRWIDAKHTVKRGLSRLPLVGDTVTNLVERAKRMVRLTLVPGEFFEALGFGYLGPIDGHDIPTLERALRDARAMQRPIVVHAVTQKGRGYALAEKHPERFHGVAPFFVESGKNRKAASTRVVSTQSVVEEVLPEAAQEDARIVAITAAMVQGTGLLPFSERFPDRFFDVGIAEEHAMTLAAGMAAGGLRPVYAVYATFLQRACDQLLHDICLQRLPVTLLVSNAGFVQGDGATHQGVYDLAMLRPMPGLTIWSPCDAAELRAMIRAAIVLDGPCVIRYPKMLPERIAPDTPADGWRRVTATEGPQVQLISYGFAVQTAQRAAALLDARGIACEVWSASTLHAPDARALKTMRNAAVVAVVEETQNHGGIGEMVAGWFAAQKGGPLVLPLGIAGIVPSSNTVDGLLKESALEPEVIAGRIEEAFHEQA